MINAIPFHPDHLHIIKPKDMFNYDESIIERMRNMYGVEGTVAFSLFSGVQIVAIVGGYHLWPGVMEVFSLTSQLVYRHAKSFIKIMKSILGMYARAFSIRRYQVALPFDLPNRDKYARVLGFDFEAILKAWGPEGKDYYLYRRLY